MPELPEVETIRRDLAKEIIGLNFEGVETNTPKMVRPSPAEFTKALKGKKFVEVRRRAKLLIFELDSLGDSPAAFVIHLRLTGRLLLRKAGDPPDEFQRAVFKLSGERRLPREALAKWGPGLELRLADLRKFGYARLIRNKDELKKLLAAFGPEPFDDLTKEKFREILAKSGRRLKDILMDQGVISGIGNIYANDALWLARLHPLSRGNKLTPKQADQLYYSILKILEKSLKLRGSSDRPGYRDIYGEKGNYQDHFLTYQRTGKPCLRGDGKIERISIGGRGTFLCKTCQKLVV